MPAYAHTARRLLLLALLGAASLAGAADLRISLPALPSTEPKGPWARLAHAIAREWHEGKVTILGPLPFEQSVDNVVSGHADVHFPLISSPARYEDELPYQYSSVTLGEVPFALYTRKGDERINPKALTIEALSKLRIETDRAHARLFYFRLREADSIETALQRVSAGQIDGFLFSANATDTVLKRLKLDNIVRTPYRRFKNKMLLPKGQAGDDLDEKLSLIIDRLKDSGEYQRIMAPVLGVQIAK